MTCAAAQLLTLFNLMLKERADYEQTHHPLTGNTAFRAFTFHHRI